jgi:hypothetical protein
MCVTCSPSRVRKENISCPLACLFVLTTFGQTCEFPLILRRTSCNWNVTPLHNFQFPLVSKSKSVITKISTVYEKIVIFIVEQWCSVWQNIVIHGPSLGTELANTLSRRDCFLETNTLWNTVSRDMETESWESLGDQTVAWEWIHDSRNNTTERRNCKKWWLPSRPPRRSWQAVNLKRRNQSEIQREVRDYSGSIHQTDVVQKVLNVWAVIIDCNCIQCQQSRRSHQEPIIISHTNIKHVIIYSNNTQEFWNFCVEYGYQQCLHLYFVWWQEIT